MSRSARFFLQMALLLYSFGQITTPTSSQIPSVSAVPTPSQLPTLIPNFTIIPTNPSLQQGPSGSGSVLASTDIASSPDLLSELVYIWAMYLNIPPSRIRIDSVDKNNTVHYTIFVSPNAGLSGWTLVLWLTNAMNSGLVSSPLIVPNTAIVDVQTTAPTANPTSSSTSNESSLLLPIIIGVSAAVVLALIVSIAIAGYCFCYKRRRKPFAYYRQLRTNAAGVSELEMYDNYALLAPDR